MTLEDKKEPSHDRLDRIDAHRVTSFNRAGGFGRRYIAALAFPVLALFSVSNAVEDARFENTHNAAGTFRETFATSAASYAAYQEISKTVPTTKRDHACIAANTTTAGGANVLNTPGAMTCLFQFNKETDTVSAKPAIARNPFFWTFALGSVLMFGSLPGAYRKWEKDRDRAVAWNTAYLNEKKRCDKMQPKP